MAVSSAHGTISILSSEGVGTTYLVSGLSFAPKVIFFMWSGCDGATDEAELADGYSGFGFATGIAARRGIGSWSQHNVGTAPSRFGVHDAAVVATVGASNFTGLLDVDQFNSDGFRAIIDDQFDINVRVKWLALGGDITNAVVGTFTTPAVTGDQNIETVGFQPDFVMILSIGRYSATVPPNSGQQGGVFIGAADAAVANLACLHDTDDAVATTQSISYGLSTEAAVHSNSSASDVTTQGTITTMLSNGFRINYTNVQGGSDYMFYLALKGGSYKVGELLTRTDGNDISVSGLSFKPAAALFLSTCNAEHAAGTPSEGARYSYGMAASPAAQAAVGGSTKDNVATSSVERALEHDSVYVALDGSGAKEGSMKLNSFNADGMTLAMDDPDPSAKWVGYIAFGPAAAGETLFPHDGTKPWSNIWRPARI